MSAPSVPKWLTWAREIQALAQTGLHFAQDDYNRSRFRRLLDLAAEIVRDHTGADVPALQGIFLAQPGYATPKVDVRGAVFREGRILLVRERSDGGWCMPGGWADVGELPSAMVVREVWEESGFRVVARKLIGVYDANRDGTPLAVFHAYKVVMLCVLLSGEPTPSSETSAVDFFGREAIPPLSSARTSPRLIAEAFAHLDDPLRPPAFD
ncbi:MAG: NUDIX hydrolase [Chloroflexi bacterium]|jgi:ADP-ribose pyrophosphatase YjhB (NUDIX family)|nr:NUDIX hydrolase [Chloroflexota bacterium]